MRKKLIIIYSGIFIFLIFLAIIITSVFFNKRTNSTNINGITPSPQTSIVQSDENFMVSNTYPSNHATGIGSGEIMITFTTSLPILNKNDISISLSPQLQQPAYYAVINSFPSSAIQVQIYGGLQPTTIYTVTVNNKNGQLVYSWSFTTGSAAAQQSSSQLQTQIDKQTLQNDYPLAKWIPYSTAIWQIIYTDKNTLEVTIGSSDNGQPTDVNAVKQEVNAWIKSHGVDPSSQTINYIDNSAPQSPLQ